MHTMTAPIPSRRAFLAATAGSAALLVAPAAHAAGGDAPAARRNSRAYTFEITRSDADWRARLAPEEYIILRKGSTELPHTSALVKESREGIYRCKAAP